MTRLPRYWMHEVGGVLAPAVRRYLEGHELNTMEVATMRGYLRQWVATEVFSGAAVEELRREVDKISTTEDVRAWLEKALDESIDPL